jgi:hypothetical protein
MDFLDVPQNLAIDGLLFESSVEPFHNSVGLRLLHEVKAKDQGSIDLRDKF